MIYEILRQALDEDIPITKQILKKRSRLQRGGEDKKLYKKKSKVTGLPYQIFPAVEREEGYRDEAQRKRGPRKTSLLYIRISATLEKGSQMQGAL